mgnify:CR=1 FL=1
MNSCKDMCKWPKMIYSLPAIVALMLIPLVFDHDSQSLMHGSMVLASDDGGHASGGHSGGGHSAGGHSGGGHSAGGGRGGYSSGGGRDSDYGKGAASNKRNPAADQRSGERASDPDAERGVGYHGGTSLESKVLRGGGSGGHSGSHTDGETDDHTDHDHTDDESHDDDSHSSGSKGNKPPNAGGEDDHEH